MRGLEVTVTLIIYVHKKMMASKLIVELSNLGA